MHWRHRPLSGAFGVSSLGFYRLGSKTGVNRPDGGRFSNVSFIEPSINIAATKLVVAVLALRETTASKLARTKSAAESATAVTVMGNDGGGDVAAERLAGELLKKLRGERRCESQSVSRDKLCGSGCGTQSRVNCRVYCRANRKPYRETIA